MFSRALAHASDSLPDGPRSSLVEDEVPRYSSRARPGGALRHVVVHCVAGRRWDSAGSLVVPLAQDTSGIVRLAWSGTAMTVRARASDIGEVEGRVELRKPVEQEGAIAFNAKYLLEYLEDKSGPVLLETNGPDAPGVWSIAEQPRVVLMPMFVQNDPPTPSPTDGSPAQAALEEQGESSEEEESNDHRPYVGQDDPAEETEQDGTESVA